MSNIFVIDDEAFKEFETPLRTGRTNISDVSNGDSSSTLCPQIVNDRNLKGEVEEKKMRKWPTVRKRSNRVYYNVWMDIKTQFEVVMPIPGINLKPGYQVINNGKCIDGNFCVINEGHNKLHPKNIQGFKIEAMKTESSYGEMMLLPSLICLYKCLDSNCSASFVDKKSFMLHVKTHFSIASENKKKHIYNDEQFAFCVYCLRTFNDENMLANHIDENYTFCKYFCQYCPYRAYTGCHLLTHQFMVHKKSKPAVSIFNMSKDTDYCEDEKEMLKVVNFKKFILPFFCTVDFCNFTCFLEYEFIEHLNQVHKSYKKFYCYICEANNDVGSADPLIPKSLIKHLIRHEINLFQCIFCLFGSEIISVMMCHLAKEHFEYEPLCLRRSSLQSHFDAKKIENLHILKIKKCVDNTTGNMWNVPATTEFQPKMKPKKRFEYKERVTVCSAPKVDERARRTDPPVKFVTYTAQKTGMSRDISTNISTDISIPLNSGYRSPSDVPDGANVIFNASQNQSPVPDGTNVSTPKILKCWSMAPSITKESQDSEYNKVIVGDVGKKLSDTGILTDEKMSPPHFADFPETFSTPVHEQKRCEFIINTFTTFTLQGEQYILYIDENQTDGQEENQTDNYRPKLSRLLKLSDIQKKIQAELQGIPKIRRCWSDANIVEKTYSHDEVITIDDDDDDEEQSKDNTSDKKENSESSTQRSPKHLYNGNSDICL